MRPNCFRTLTSVFAFAPFLALPTAEAATVANPICPDNTALFNPDNGNDIVVPAGFKVSVFVSGLNAPTGIAFKGNSQSFEVYVLESGHGLPSVCNDQSSPVVGGEFSTNNPFTPDIKVYNRNGTLLRGPLGKPTGSGGVQTGGFQAEGPAVDIAFERGFQGGRLFATDSNQSLRTTGRNNSSRIIIVDPMTGQVTPFITNLPTGDHPSEQLEFKGGWIYWSQGSTTNSGVVGLDNGGGTNQPDIPCQKITLSDNLFDSGGGKMTSGYSPFNTDNRGKTLAAFSNGRPGVCDGAILRAPLNNPSGNRALLVGVPERLRHSLRA